MSRRMDLALLIALTAMNALLTAGYALALVFIWSTPRDASETAAGVIATVLCPASVAALWTLAARAWRTR